MKLKIIEGSDEGEIITLDKNAVYTIGRDVDCDICISDLRSSRKHAKIFFENERFYIEDLNSTNGVHLNGNTIFKMSLSQDDKLLVGDTLFLVIDDVLSAGKKTQAIHIQDDGKASTVIISALPHGEADLLYSAESQKIEDLVLENRILKKVGEISQIVATLKNTDEILQEVLENMQEILNADTGSVLIWSVEHKDWSVRTRVSTIGQESSITVSRTIINQSLENGMAILSTNPLMDNRFDPSMSIISQGISSAICSPIKIKDKFSGMLIFDKRKSEKVFNELELKFTVTIANILGILLENELLAHENMKRTRLSVIGEVIAELAHYTKNIITGLRFSINTLEMLIEKEKWEGLPKCLRAIMMQERRISELVLNMLSYSKDRVPMPSEINIYNLLEDMAEPYMDHLKEEKIELDIISPNKNVKVFGEDASIHRIFLNLLVNAFDSFKNKPKDSVKKIRINVIEKENNMVDVKFYDTGCGIAEDKLDKIFNIFFSTKGSEGTGLGLAVVKKIIDEHKGSITVESVYGKWTEFTVTLPIYSA